MSNLAVFDYPDTCPRIDNAINVARAELEDLMEQLVAEALPTLSLSGRRQMAAGWSERSFALLEEAFEATRRTNVAMRAAAQTQIDRMARQAWHEQELQGVARFLSRRQL